MMVIRGVNMFPSSVEQILRSFPEVVEYRMTVRKVGEMDHLMVEIEDRLNEPDARGRRIAPAAGSEGRSAGGAAGKLAARRRQRQTVRRRTMQADTPDP